MTGTHSDAAVRAVTAALGTRLAPGITSFPQLLTDDGVIEVPFDGDGGTPPMRGLDALTAMVNALNEVLRFDKVTVTHVHDVEPSTVICEHEALLHRADLGSSFRCRYIAVMTLQDRRARGPHRPDGRPAGGAALVDGPACIRCPAARTAR